MHREKTKIYAAHRTHTERTHTEQNKRYNNMQHIEDNREQNTDTDTIHNTEKNTYTSTENSAHNYRTYSLDYYFEFAYIKNSNTIELYTISKD